MAVKTNVLVSGDNLVISPIKELMTGGHPHDMNRVYHKDVLVTLHDSSFHNELAHKQFFSLTDNNSGNNPLTDTVNWVEDNVVKYLSTDILVTIGPTGDFPHCQEAFLYMSRFKMVDGAKLTFEFETGFIETKQTILVGVDLSSATLQGKAGETLTFDITGMHPPGSTVSAISVAASKFPVIYSDIEFIGTLPIVGYSIFNIDAGYLKFRSGTKIIKNITSTGINYMVTANNAAIVDASMCTFNGTVLDGFGSTCFNVNLGAFINVVRGNIFHYDAVFSVNYSSTLLLQEVGLGNIPNSDRNIVQKGAYLNYDVAQSPIHITVRYGGTVSAVGCHSGTTCNIAWNTLTPSGYAVK